MAAIVAAAFAIAPATAAKKGLTKKKAMNLFFTKGGADARFINVGEATSSFAQETTLMQDFVEGDVLTHSVTVPAAGTLLIWANVSFEEDAGTPDDEPVHATVLLNGAPVGTKQESNSESVGSFSNESIANAVSAPVTAGTHQVKLNLFSVEGAEIAIEGRSILTLFLPT